MDPIARRTEIVNIIRDQDRVTVDELSKSLHASKETIRRDLTELVRVGQVQKFHGGASLPMTTGEGLFRERMRQNVAGKVAIAAEAVKLFSPGETILIDTGSTTLYFAEQLAEISNLTIVTNSTEIAKVNSLSPSHSQTFLLGGEFNGDNQQTIGCMVVSQLRLFRAHHTVLTIGALDVRTGVMDFCIEESQVARAMIEQAESVTVLVDHSKFNRIASFEVCGLNQITNLVCDQPPTGAIKEALVEAGVTILSAKQ